MTVQVRQLAAGFRCTCHHPRRRCKVQCPDTALVVRPSDGRPVCGHCVYHDPEDSAGFNVEDHYWAEAPQ